MSYNILNTETLAEMYRKHRKALSERLPEKALLIVMSADEQHRNGDQFFPFRQSSDMLYLSGITQEHSILALCPGHGSGEMREILFIEKSTENSLLWEGEKLSKEEAARISGVDSLMWLDSFPNVLADLMDKAGPVFLGEGLDEDIAYDWQKPAGRDLRFARYLRGKYPRRIISSYRETLNELRMVKSPGEIERTKQACKITGETFRELLPLIQPGMNEKDVEAEMTAFFMKKGADGHAFAPIVASGQNACVLHYVRNNMKMKDGELLLMDFGAEYRGYASDMSRTLPVNGHFSKRQREVYSSVKSVFERVRGQICEGLSIRDLQMKTIRYIEEELLKLKLVTKKDLQRSPVHNPAFLTYYGHGVSHFMGLDVHDVGSKDIRLKPGMVITCEPGIYIAEENIGIRLENDIIVPTKGKNPIDLLKDVPMDMDEIEAGMGR